MDISAFTADKSPRKRPKRRGRGKGSGLGGTSGRGHNGQKSRSGGKVARGFEGGQMPLARRIPKWGFTNIFRTEYEVCNVSDLNCFESGETVDRASLQRKGLIRKSRNPLKILGTGDIMVQVTVQAQRFSSTAAEKIKAAGGQTELV